MSSPIFAFMQRCSWCPSWLTTFSWKGEFWRDLPLSFIFGIKSNYLQTRLVSRLLVVDFLAEEFLTGVVRGYVFLFGDYFLLDLAFSTNLLSTADLKRFSTFLSETLYSCLRVVNTSSFSRPFSFSWVAN